MKRSTLLLLLAAGCTSVVTPEPVSPPPEPLAVQTAPPKGLVQTRKIELDAGGCCTALVATTGAGEKADSPFAGDKGSKLIDEALQPAEQAVTRELKREQPRKFAPPASVTPQVSLPLLPLRPPHVDPIQRELAKVPRPALEGTPLAQQRGDAPRPTEIALPTELLPRLPAPDPSQPAGVPVLAQPKVDRAPLADPAAPASLAAVLREPVPVRTTQAPFRPENLPDPFPNRLPSQLRTVDGEVPTPPVLPLAVPTKK